MTSGLPIDDSSGWHTYCLDPPLGNTPSGTWHCPDCPEVPPEPEPKPETEPELEPPLLDPMIEVPRQMPIPQPPMVPITAVGYERTPSMASSSNSVARPRGGYGPSKVVVSSDDESDEEEDEDKYEDTEDELDVGTAAVVTQRKKKRNLVKGKDTKHGRVSEVAPTPRPTKRLRVHGPTSPTVPPPKPAIRLLLGPRKTRAKEEEEEEAKKGLFDDILSEKDRDTSATSIINSDKLRFERSRQAAEVRLSVVHHLEHTG
jgi:hypothetical protein